MAVFTVGQKVWYRNVDKKYIKRGVVIKVMQEVEALNVNEFYDSDPDVTTRTLKTYFVSLDDDHSNAEYISTEGANLYATLADIEASSTYRGQVLADGPVHYFELESADGSGHSLDTIDGVTAWGVQAPYAIGATLGAIGNGVTRVGFDGNFSQTAPVNQLILPPVFTLEVVSSADLLLAMLDIGGAPCAFGAEGPTAIGFSHPGGNIYVSSVNYKPSHWAISRDADDVITITYNGLQIGETVVVAGTAELVGALMGSGTPDEVSFIDEIAIYDKVIPHSHLAARAALLGVTTPVPMPTPTPSTTPLPPPTPTPTPSPVPLESFGAYFTRLNEEDTAAITLSGNNLTGIGNTVDGSPFVGLVSGIEFIKDGIIAVATSDFVTGGTTSSIEVAEVSTSPIDYTGLSKLDVTGFPQYNKFVPFGSDYAWMVSSGFSSVNLKRVEYTESTLNVVGGTLTFSPGGNIAFFTDSAMVTVSDSLVLHYFVGEVLESNFTAFTHNGTDFVQGDTLVVESGDFVKMFNKDDYLVVVRSTTIDVYIVNAGTITLHGTVDRNNGMYPVNSNYVLLNPTNGMMYYQAGVTNYNENAVLEEINPSAPSTTVHISMPLDQLPEPISQFWPPTAVAGDSMLFAAYADLGEGVPGSDIHHARYLNGMVLYVGVTRTPVRSDFTNFVAFNP